MKTALIFLILIIITSGCISTRQSENQLKELTGISTIVGNEPFTHSAILTDQKEVYLVEGSKEIMNLLYENQGKYFKVTYDKSRDSLDLKIINVISASKQ